MKELRASILTIPEVLPHICPIQPNPLRPPLFGRQIVTCEGHVHALWIRKELKLYNNSPFMSESLINNMGARDAMVYVLKCDMNLAFPYVQAFDWPLMQPPHYLVAFPHCYKLYD